MWMRVRNDACENDFVPVGCLTLRIPALMRMFSEQLHADRLCFSHKNSVSITPPNKTAENTSALTFTSVNFMPEKSESQV